MADLAGLLKSQITKLNATFEAADAVLHQEVQKLQRAIEAVAPGIEVRLDTHTNDASGISYVLIVQGGGQSSNVLFFRIPSTGYPIEAGDSVPHLQKIADHAEGLPAFVERLVGDSSSALVTKVAFLARKKLS